MCIHLCPTVRLQQPYKGLSRRSFVHPLCFKLSVTDFCSVLQSKTRRFSDSVSVPLDSFWIVFVIPSLGFLQIFIYVIKNSLTSMLMRIFVNLIIQPGSFPSHDKEHTRRRTTLCFLAAFRIYCFTNHVYMRMLVIICSITPINYQQISPKHLNNFTANQCFQFHPQRLSLVTDYVTLEHKSWT